MEQGNGLTRYYKRIHHQLFTLMKNHIPTGMLFPQKSSEIHIVEYFEP
jgi:hypothetical protein